METEIKIRKKFRIPDVSPTENVRVWKRRTAEQQGRHKKPGKIHFIYLFIYLAAELLAHLFAHSNIYSFRLMYLPAPLLHHVLCISDSTYQRPLNCSARQSSLPVPAINISRVRLNRLACKRISGRIALC